MTVHGKPRRLLLARSGTIKLVGQVCVAYATRTCPKSNLPHPGAFGHCPRSRKLRKTLESGWSRPLEAPCQQNANGVLSQSPGLRGTSNPGSADAAVATPTGLWPGSDAKKTRVATPIRVATSAGGWRPRPPQPRWGCHYCLALRVSAPAFALRAMAWQAFLALTLGFATRPLWGP